MTPDTVFVSPFGKVTQTLFPPPMPLVPISNLGAIREFAASQGIHGRLYNFRCGISCKNRQAEY